MAQNNNKPLKSALRKTAVMRSGGLITRNYE